MRTRNARRALLGVLLAAFLGACAPSLSQFKVDTTPPLPEGSQEPLYVGEWVPKSAGPFCDTPTFIAEYLSDMSQVGPGDVLGSEIVLNVWVGINGCYLGEYGYVIRKVAGHVIVNGRAFTLLRVDLSFGPATSSVFTFTTRDVLDSLPL